MTIFKMALNQGVSYKIPPKCKHDNYRGFFYILQQNLNVLISPYFTFVQNKIKRKLHDSRANLIATINN
ncbi:hypothetical protein HZS_6800 [Henneguya salminicola]|nr:hypothetical protein HZS_6800 [Henneguya salminicola]